MITYITRFWKRDKTLTKCWVLAVVVLTQWEFNQQMLEKFTSVQPSGLQLSFFPFTLTHSPILPHAYIADMLIEFIVWLSTLPKGYMAYGSVFTAYIGAIDSWAFLAKSREIALQHDLSVILFSAVLRWGKWSGVKGQKSKESISQLGTSLFSLTSFPQLKVLSSCFDQAVFAGWWFPNQELAGLSSFPLFFYRFLVLRWLSRQP